MKRRKRSYSYGGPVTPTVPAVSPQRKPLFESSLLSTLPIDLDDPEAEKVNNAIRRLYMSQHPAMKRGRKKKAGEKEEKNTGGAIGTVGGAALGSIIPGVGTALGAKIGGAAGSIIGGLFGRRKKQEEPEPPPSVGRVFQASYGFQDGGTIRRRTSTRSAIRPGIHVRPVEGTATSLPVRSTVQSQPVRSTVQSQPVRSTVTSKPVRSTVTSRRVGNQRMQGPNRFQEGGPIQSMQVGGVAHEAGGVTLEEFGRPEVEVERGESILFDAMGEPDYVFSALRMKDKPRTFAEEFERLKEKGDLKAIRNLKRKQEEQMGRKINVTMDSTTKQAQFAKYGGDLKRDGGSMHGYSVKKATSKYGGKLKRGGSAWGSKGYVGLQSGGTVPPWANPRTFYVNPQGGAGTSLPQNPGPRVFTPGPGGTGISGLPSGPIGRNLPSGPVGRNLPVPYQAPGFRVPWGPMGVAATVGYGLGEMATPGRTLPGEFGRWREAKGNLATAEENRIAAEQERDRMFELYGQAPDKPVVPNVRPADQIIEEDIDLSMPEQAASIGRRDVPGAMLTDGTVTPPEILAQGVEEGVSPEATAGDTLSGEVGTVGDRNWLQTVGDIAPYAADLFNIGVASRMKPPKRPGAFTPELMDTRISTTQDEATLTTQARAILADPNASSTQKLAAMGQLHRARGGVRAQAEQQRGQIRRGNVQAINRAREINQQVGERHSDRVAQFRGARASAISGGVRSIADRLERRGFESRAQELEPMKLMAMMHHMPTEDRRAFIEDLLASLPPGHRLHQSLGQIHGGV